MNHHRTLDLRAALLAGFALLAVTACDKGSGDAKSEAAASDAPKSNAKAGKVTVERFEAFDNAKVNENAANFNQCVAAAEAQLGAVSKVEGNEYSWAAKSGDDCHMYILVGNGDGMMSRSTGPYKVGDDEKDKCMEIAG